MTQVSNRFIPGETFAFGWDEELLKTTNPKQERFSKQPLEIQPALLRNDSSTGYITFTDTAHTLQRGPKTRTHTSTVVINTPRTHLKIVVLSSVYSVETHADMCIQ